MKNLGIDYIMIYNSTGNLVLSEAIAPHGSVKTSVPAELEGIIHNSIISEDPRKELQDDEESPISIMTRLFLPDTPSVPEYYRAFAGNSRHGEGTDQRSYQ